MLNEPGCYAHQLGVSMPLHYKLPLRKQRDMSSNKRKGTRLPESLVLELAAYPVFEV